MFCFPPFFAPHVPSGTLVGIVAGAACFESVVTWHTMARGRTATGGTTATGDKRWQGSAGRRDDGNGRHDKAA
jgi:hypothetical protein